MNDMRLPGLGLLNNEPQPSHEGSANAPRDPAQAFDAVMSRFSNERAPAPAAETTAAKANNTTTRAPGKAPAAASGHSAQPSGQPVAHTAATDGSEDCADPVAASATDPTVLMAMVVDSAQVAAQNPALAAALNPVVAPPVGKEAKTDTASSAAALDVLAGQVNAATGRIAEKKPVDAHAPSAAEDDITPVGTGTTPNRRTPTAAKDTLRIDAPLTRTLDVTKLDVTQRFAAIINAGTQSTAQAASAPSAETTAQAIAAAVAGASASASTATYSIAHTAVSTPVGASGFANELAQRVVVFAGQKVQRAEIAVTPADLGPIAVSIEVRGQEATLAFSAASHTTRAAIEDALPRLRDMLSAQGLHLAGTHVGSEPRRDPYRPARKEQNGNGTGATRDGVATISAPTNAEMRRRMNLIDIEV